MVEAHDTAKRCVALHDRARSPRRLAPTGPRADTRPGRLRPV